MSDSTYHKLSLGLFGLTLFLIPLAWRQVFLIVPTEKTMGIVQRIFYIHLPSAFIAFFAFFIVFLASTIYLITRKKHWDWVAASAAEVGVISCAVVLITGPLWAKPVWGIWWTWDARLTSTLVLFMIYVGYLMLRFYVLEEGRRARLSAVFGILGFVDVPIVYMANRWWRTQHPAPVISGGEGSGLDPRMWTALWWCVAAMACWSLFLFLHRYRLERTNSEFVALARKVQA
jgi:heme exporter protein C